MIMDKKYKVSFRGQQPLEFEEGTTYKEISEQFKELYKYDILVAKVDNILSDLSESLKKDCEIDFFDRTSSIGNSVYVRSARFLLVLAIKRLFGEEADVIIGNNIDNGTYFFVQNVEMNESVVAKIYAEMKEIVKQDYLFTKLSVFRMDAIKYFKKKKSMDKVNVLKYISNTYVNLYRINDMYDYFYDRLAYSTKSIDDFNLTYIEQGVVAITTPKLLKPNSAAKYVHHEKMFNEYKDYMNWLWQIGVLTAADLNKTVSQANEVNIINLAEAHYNSQLTRIADEIYDSERDIKVVLLAGPSSSGKTTTAKKLDIYLRSKGFITHSIELDNYYIDLDKRKVDENGKLDFESIGAIDTDLFNKNLTDLLEGKKVNLPVYNFVTGRREHKNNYLQLGEKDIIVIEGLHALNEELTKNIPKQKKYKIYISPLTQINIDKHNFINPEIVRKLRRIVRDSKTRGYNARDTLRRWIDIEAGEEENILKFQDAADKIINSSLVYEVGVLKTYVEPLLFNVEEGDPEYTEALSLINFLRNFLPIPSDDVPADSILREFIGGSCFH